jgi:hypothetical protein
MPIILPSGEKVISMITNPAWGCVLATQVLGGEVPAGSALNHAF